MHRVTYMAALLVAIVLLSGCASAFGHYCSQIDGLYLIPEEVGGYQHERLELRNGHFHYWFSSDVVVFVEGHEVSPTKSPIRGTFRVEGHKILFSDHQVDERYIDTVNGHAVLWRSDGNSIWERQHKIYDYGVLIKVASRGSQAESPSVRVLYDEQMRKKVKVWRDPFVHGLQ